MNHHFRSYSEQLPNNNNNTINVNQNLINANNNGHTDRIIVHTNSQQSLEQLFNPDPETREKLVPLRQRNLPSSFFNPSNGRANNLHMRTQSVLAPMSSYQMQQQAPSIHQPSKSSVSVHRLEQPLKSANLVASSEMVNGNMGASALSPDQQRQHLQLGGSQSDVHEHYYQNQQQINGGTGSSGSSANSNNGSSHTLNGTNGTSATTIHNTNNNHHHRTPSQPLVPMIQPRSEQPIELGPNTNTIGNNTHLPHHHHHHHHHHHAPVASPLQPTATQFQCQAQQSQPVAQAAQILPVQQPQQPHQHHHHRHAQAAGTHQYGNYTAQSHHLNQAQQPRQNGHQYSSQQPQHQSHQFGPQPHQSQHHNQAPYSQQQQSAFASQQPHQHSHYQQQAHYQPQPQHQQQPHYHHSHQHRYEQCANQFSDQQLQQGHLFQQHYPQG